MSVILSFSDDILLDIIRQWSSVRCLVYLDSSLCNHSRRIEFVDLLKHKTLVLCNDTYDWTYNGELKHLNHQLYIIGFFNWILCKGVKLLKIKFLEINFIMSELSLTKLDFSMTTHFQFMGFEVTTRSDLLIMIRSCLNLTSLKLDNINKITDSFISKIVVLSKLTELSVVGTMPSLTQSSVEHVANSCRCLKNLTLIYYYRKTPKFAFYCPEIIINLLKHNASLVKIELNLYRELEPDESTLLSLISTYCYKTITRIYLSTINVITPVDISNCLLDCSNLLDLQLGISIANKKSNCYLLYESDIVKYKHISFYSNKHLDKVQFDLRVIELLTEISGFTRIRLQLKSSLLNADILSECILHQASTLVELILEENRICSNNSLQSILSACHKLTSLELSFCYDIDINEIEPIYFSNLLSLNIEYSPSLRTDTLILIISLSTSLKHIELFGCHKVDFDAVEEFRSNNMPQLTLKLKDLCDYL
jgi:hypothetical protein